MASPLKPAILILCLLLASWGVFPSRPRADDNPANPSPPRGSCVAIFNLEYLIAHCNKWRTLENECKLHIVGCQERKSPLRAECEILTEAIRTGKFLDPAFPDQQAAEKELRRLIKSMNDIEDEARAMECKNQETLMRTIWKDVTDAARSFAATHNVDLVMQYRDPPPDVCGCLSILRDVNLRKSSTPGLFPLPLGREGIDVTEELLAILNAVQLRSEKPSDE
jgi:hypothetical protein